ncbi:class II glutamine amidotransferase [Thermococcus sp.]|uniref:class II glutamine amidotransferase n=1 Tax=Thermococcus sp. TaxID=35749 RepID=UPI00198CA4D6|nr:class II glutamine amidotransferase [Thermococcus sp.]MBC7094489.1 class II glutamine amidotransferase [Thermococcus sp.]
MCRLLGLIANRPVDLTFSLGRFEHFAESNRSGWGVGWYEGGQAKVFKEGIAANESPNYRHVAKTVRSHIILSHVRLGTRGGDAERNSHPFVYKNWMFAHNGGLNTSHLEHLLREEYLNAIVGETDSEVYFYWLLQTIADNGDVVRGIKTAVDEIVSNGDYGGLNFILSDGKRLYAFRYSSYDMDYYSLYVLKREPSKNTPFEHYSEETGRLLQSKSLNKERAVLVSSEPLTEDEEWEMIDVGTLLVVGPDLNIEKIEIVGW